MSGVRYITMPSLEEPRVMLFIVAGEHGAVECGISHDAAYVLLHSPVRRPGFERDTVWRPGSLIGRLGWRQRGCHLLEGPCWAALAETPAGWDRWHSQEMWNVLTLMYAARMGEMA